MSFLRKLLFVLQFSAHTLALTLALFTTPSFAEEEGQFRNFYDVLEDVMADFEYDLKNGQVKGLKDLAIRNIATSENVPPSFKNHLELVTQERIMKNTKTRMIQCLACKAKRTQLDGDKVTISSNDTNPLELSRIAKSSGIENFMDIAFSYQPSGMVISYTINEPESGAVVWSRSYNSETSRAAAMRRGVDFSQVAEARKQEEYDPVVAYRGIIYYLFEKNVSGYSGTLGFGFRMSERYDNRKKEVGFEFNYLRDTSSLVGSNSSTAGTNLYDGLNVTLLFVHAWNLIGEVEAYHRVRGSVFAGIGGTYASGFLGALIRTGYEWRLGKHYAVSAVLGYRPKGTKFIGSTAVGAVQGLEFGLGVNLLF